MQVFLVQLRNLPAVVQIHKREDQVDTAVVGCFDPRHQRPRRDATEVCGQ